ncbi:alpha/beta hydrolase family protein [Wenzhouxiangella marina]|uniref:Alpha/beta hydrolase n=1 Tax=Wenzhouxiangella marina TaxID=1579979 RepID=A0A0K0XTB5_9GAMM|nr:alpha/beta hydrolase [Wenzhouxiangella marina]AKS40928.1 alpha/beta hydrolase [Wenzhouxiangella marina]MBB6087802.1 hypothetical protein [Wenzhouxiangella marina]
MNDRILTRLSAGLLGILLSLYPWGQARSEVPELVTERYEFELGGQRLVGLLDRPTRPMATVIIVHGYGETRVLEQNAWFALRSFFAGLGLNVLLWDKPGCGESDGEFDINQSVASSAEEVLAAARSLRRRAIPGSEVIGLWGISRAGWIAPLAMQADPDLAFWISVSGTDDRENARYLLEQNWRIEGRSEEEIGMLLDEWQQGFDTVWQGGSYRDYLAATRRLREDPFMQFMGWAEAVSEAGFLAYQSKFEDGTFLVDRDSGLQVYVPKFRAVLSSIDRPVLALFGEKDTNVDWRSTASLYHETLGENPAAELTIISFPDADHNLHIAETGGIREMQSRADSRYAPGFAQAMGDWLIARGFGRR